MVLGPPRQVPSLSREDAYSSMDSLLTDIGYAFEGLSRITSLDNLEHFLEDLRHGSASEQPLVRAIISLRLMDTVDVEALVKVRRGILGPTVKDSREVHP